MQLGFLDGTLRAIVRVPVSGPAAAATLHLEIDTGSQPHLCIDEDWADQLGIAKNLGHRATFADGATKTVFAGVAKVEWIGKTVDIEVIIWPRADGAGLEPQVGGRYRGQPDGLIGRNLLATTNSAGQDEFRAEARCCSTAAQRSTSFCRFQS